MYISFFVQHWVCHNKLLKKNNILWIACCQFLKMYFEFMKVDALYFISIIFVLACVKKLAMYLVHAWFAITSVLRWLWRCDWVVSVLLLPVTMMVGYVGLYRKWHHKIYISFSSQINKTYFELIKDIKYKSRDIFQYVYYN